MSDTGDRSDRQKSLFPPERIAESYPTVIGVGAIGRQVAIQLAAIGVPRLELIDFDVVETVNLGPQAYLESDVGRLKVSATADMCRALNGSIEIHEIADRFMDGCKIRGNALFCCVDSIGVRRIIWRAVGKKCDLFVDGRMSAETMRVLAAYDHGSRTHYPSTLFDDKEAFVGPCTYRSTVYCANIAAGMMVDRFSKKLRGLPIEPDVQLNLLADELIIMSERPAVTVHAAPAAAEADSDLISSDQPSTALPSGSAAS